MRYKVQITETMQRIIEIEATDLHEAIRIIKKKYQKEEIILNEKDFIDVEFNVVNEKLEIM